MVMAIEVPGLYVDEAAEAEVVECVEDTESGVPAELPDKIVEEGVSIEPERWRAGDIAALAIRLMSEIRDLRIRLEKMGDLEESGVRMEEIEALFDDLCKAERYARMGIDDLEKIMAPEV